MNLNMTMKNWNLKLRSFTLALLLVIIGLGGAVEGLAQTSGVTTRIRVFSSNPTGNACTATEVGIYGGALYLCNGGVYAAAGGGGSFTSPVIITSAANPCFVVGPNGATNPTLAVNCSVASQVTGLLVTGAAAGSGVTIGVTSSGTDERLLISAKGTANVSIGALSSITGLVAFNDAATNSNNQLDINSASAGNTTRTHLGNFANTIYFGQNTKYTGGAFSQDDTSKTSWLLEMGSGSDVFKIRRSPTASTTFTDLVTISSAGELSAVGMKIPGLSSGLLLFGGTGGAFAGSTSLFWTTGTNRLTVGDSANQGNFLGGLGAFQVRREGANNQLRLQVQGTSVDNYLVGDRSRGTFASPTAIQSGDRSLVLLGLGYDGVGGTGYHASQIDLIATENWSATNHGSAIDFWVIPTTTTTQTKMLRLDGNGLSFGANDDTYLTRDTANTLAQRNSTNAQTFRVYGTYTDASNYKRLDVIGNDGITYAGIQTSAAGTGGSGDNLAFGTSGTRRWYITTAGHFLAQVDNTYDIGASGATRPRTGYFGTDVIIGGIFQTATTGAVRWSGQARITSPGGGVIALFNDAATDFSRLQFGGTTSSFPALKRSSTELQVRLADDSAFADFAAQNFRANSGAIGTSGVGVITIGNGTAPTTSPADTNQIYSADSVAGKSNLFARNENGAITRLTGLGTEVATQFDATTTTLANVTNLSHDVEAGRTYAFKAWLVVDANVTGGSKYAIAGTATATRIKYDVKFLDNSTNAYVITSRQTALGGSVGQAGTTAGEAIIEGTIVVNVAGTLTVQFAQNAASGTSSVLTTSNFLLWPIS